MKKDKRYLHTLISILTTLFISSYICLPLSRVGNTSIYTILLAILAIFTIPLYLKGWWNINKKQVKAITNIIIEYILLSTLGFTIAAFFTDAIFGLSAFISNKIMLVIYAFIFSVLCQDKDIRNTMILTIVASSFLVSLYAIFCYVTQTNPYITYIELKYNVEGLVGGENPGFATRGLTHRVSGNIGNPVYFGGVILLYISICFIQIKNKYFSIIRYVVVIFLCIALVFTGSRSSMGPLFLFIVLYIYKFYKKKLAIILPAFCLLSIASIITLSKYINFDTLFSSFTANSYNADGSSFEMRYAQFNGLMDVVGDNILFGNGVGWINNYISKYGMHPVLEGFESIILSVYTEGGMWGLFIVFPLFFYKLYLFIIKFSGKKTSFFPKLLLFIFIIFSLLTGMYGIKLFIIFLILAVNSTYRTKETKKRVLLTSTHKTRVGNSSTNNNVLITKREDVLQTRNEDESSNQRH